jgi:hypothetical protein
MSNKNLFKEAIADAKAVREAALLNAKNALEEALAPSIQNMLAAKLNEMSDEYGMEEEAMMGVEKEEEMKMEEDFDLASILAELELEEQAELAEAKKAEDEGEEEEKEEEEGEEEEKGEEEAEEEIEVKDMSVEDLKALIKDVVSQELEAEELEMPADEAGEAEMDINMGDMGNMEAGEEEEINLEELLAELDSLEEEAELEEAKKMKKHGKEAKETKEELEEAIRVINTLRTQLSETNLLNAKLLYVNKIFKAKNLTESQKLNVIASFDKATTAKEAKMVYESLNTTLTSTVKKAAIKESLGFASKATGIAPKKQIVESNDVISRMQKLANIIK